MAKRDVHARHVQHIAHEATRLAGEEIRHKGRTLVPKGGVLPPGVGTMPGLRAVGSIAFASIYTMRDGIKPVALKPFYVEREYKGVWVTADKWLQRLSIEEARDVCRRYPQYRLVVPNALGVYNPEKR